VAYYWRGNVYPQHTAVVLDMEVDDSIKTGPLLASREEIEQALKASPYTIHRIPVTDADAFKNEYDRGKKSIEAFLLLAEKFYRKPL